MASVPKSLTEYNHLAEEIRSGKFKPIYLLLGDESYFIDSLAELFLEHTIPADHRPFNQHLFYGPEVKDYDLVNVCLRAPMRHDRMLVVVRDAQSIRFWEPLVEYSKAPSPQTVLVLCYNGSVDRRATRSPLMQFVTQVKRVGVEYRADPLREYEMDSWLVSLLQSKGLKAKGPVVQLLINLVGANLRLMSHEIDKLRLSLPEGRNEITAEDVQGSVGLQREFTVFDFNRAIGTRDRVLALRVANYLASTNKSGQFIAVLSSLFNYFQKIVLFHSLRRSLNDQELAVRMGVKPFFLREYAQAARQYPLGECLRVIGLLRDFDLQAKGVATGNASELSNLRMLIATVIG